MNATCPARASYTFRSILHGRELLREGVIWRIGDGSLVNIHHANWIPRAGSLRPLGQNYIQGITRVSDLVNAEGTTWDHEKIDEIRHWRCM